MRQRAPAWKASACARSGAVLAAPRAPLVRRFGKQLLLRLDQALGRIEEALSPRLPVPALSVERHLAEPITLTEDIESLIAMLAATLRKELERRGEGAGRCNWRSSGSTARCAALLSAHRVRCGSRR